MPEKTIHPIRLEIYRNLFFSIAEEMGTVLRRTSYSPNIKERRDYSCAVFDQDGELVAMGDHMPVHLGSMPLSVRAAIDWTPLLPGDIVALNDPFSGGTHLPDITLVAPVFAPSAAVSKPTFYVACRAHHSDVGGMSPGSMPLGREIFQEGLIIPPVKLYEGGRLNRGLLRLVLHNVRTPVEREGDLAAQVGSLRIGEKRLLEILERNGRKEIVDYVHGLQDYADQVIRSLIQSIPDGDYEAEDFLDDDGIETNSTSRAVRLKVKISVSGDKMRVDFSGTDGEVAGNLNAVPAITLSAVYYVMRSLAPEDVPSSGGLLKPVEVLAPEGSVVNASFPHATVGGNVETSQRIVDVLLRALSEALPDRVPAASSGTMNNVALGGTHPGTKLPFSYYETIGGGMGATASRDGDNGVHTHMTNSLNTPIEAFERDYPVRVREYRLRPGSGGRGLRSGGEGIIRTLEMLSETQVTILSERRKFAPYGLQGGRPGKKGMNFVAARGRRRRVPGKASLNLIAGDMLCIETPGGGGWGTSQPSRSGHRPERRNRSTKQERPTTGKRTAPSSRRSAEPKGKPNEPRPASQDGTPGSAPPGERENEQKKPRQRSRPPRGGGRRRNVSSGKERGSSERVPPDSGSGPPGTPVPKEVAEAPRPRSRAKERTKAEKPGEAVVELEWREPEPRKEPPRPKVPNKSTARDKPAAPDEPTAPEKPSKQDKSSEDR